ncbi:Guanosine polyphosphate pyrophosphohydrolase/synthetase [Desulfosporosinus sp. I2]|nr:Guanosine polyphosphate pyrophosphohydrolase/synthetase [Desulfosporosinus sp. I2]
MYGLKESVGETIKEILNSPWAVWELVKDIKNGNLSLTDLADGLGESVAGPIKHLIANSGEVWDGDPTDAQVQEYGKNLGDVIQQAILAGGAVKTGIKAIDKLIDASKGAGKVDKGFNSFNALKKELGSAGEGKAWHHIVEQNQIRKSGFSPQQIHNTNNVIAVDSATHAKISGYYNSIRPDISGNMRVRDWLAGQSYEYQYEFGIDVLKQFGVIK